MKKNNSHIALGAHKKHLKWTFIPNGSSIFILMQQGKRNSYLIDVWKSHTNLTHPVKVF